MTAKEQPAAAPSFTWNGAVIRFRALTVADEEAIGDLMLRLSDDSRHANTRYTFGEYLIGADVEGEPPVPLVSPDAPEGDLRAAFDAFRRLPRQFLTEWRALVTKAENSPKP